MNISRMNPATRSRFPARRMRRMPSMRFLSAERCLIAGPTRLRTPGSTVESGSFTATDITSSNNNGNANTLNTFYKNQSRVQYPEFISFTNSQTANCSVDLALSSTTDRKALQVEGNAIASWEQDSGATGRFLDSASNAINLENHGQIYVGSLISTIDASINNPTDGNDYTISSATSLGTPFTITSGDTVTVSGGDRLRIRRPATKLSARMLPLLRLTLSPPATR